MIDEKTALESESERVRLPEDPTGRLWRRHERKLRRRRVVTRVTAIVIAALVLSVALRALLPIDRHVPANHEIQTLAHAGGVRDPDEPGHRLDMRWVVVHQRADGTIRVTMTFYDPVHLSWFYPDGHLAHAGVWFGVGAHLARFTVGFYRTQHPWLSAELCKTGVRCSSPVQVLQPNATTITASFGPMFGSFAGRRFMGKTFWDSGPYSSTEAVDSTGIGIV